jgi:hypothetical protein
MKNLDSPKLIALLSILFATLTVGGCTRDDAIGNKYPLHGPRLSERLR